MKLCIRLASHISRFWHQFFFSIIKQIMSANFFEDKKGSTPDPSQSNNSPEQSGTVEESQQEGSFRNVETGVSNMEYFNDDFESQQEDEITKEEADTEKEGRTGKS